MKLVHIRKREGRRGGKYFRNGGGGWGLPGIANMTAMRTLVAGIVALLLAAFVMAFGGCYAHDPAPPPCANCNDPTAPPPTVTLPRDPLAPPFTPFYSRQLDGGTDR